MSKQNTRKQSKKKDKKGDYGRYAREFSAREELVIYKNPARNTPYPRRYRTIVKTSMSGYVAAGTGATRYFARMNSVYLPFNGGGWAALTPAAATVKPTGLSHLFAADFYNLARVISSRIKVIYSPGDAADTVQLTVTPSSTNLFPATVEAASGQDYNKFKQITIGTPLSSQTVTNEVSQSLLLGVREQAIQDDLSGQFTCSYLSHPVQTMYWVVNFRPDNGGVTAQPAAISVILEHDVELWANADANQPEAMVEAEGTPGPCTCCHK
jgi:hypothetical protein